MVVGKRSAEIPNWRNIFPTLERKEEKLKTKKEMSFQKKKKKKKAGTSSTSVTDPKKNVTTGNGKGSRKRGLCSEGEP